MSFDTLSVKGSMGPMSLEDLTEAREKSMQHVKIQMPEKEVSSHTLYDKTETVAFALKREEHDNNYDQDMFRAASILEEGYDELLKRGMESDSSSAASLTSVSMEYQDLSLQTAFFDDLGEIPDLDDISLDITIDEEREVEVEAVTLEETADTGKFVDPLTGEKEESSEEPAPEPQPVEEEEVEEEEVDEDFEYDLGLPPDIDEDEQLADKGKVLEDETFEALIAMETVEKVEIVEEIDFEALERENAAKLLLENTNEFLQEIITSVVDTCEYIDPNNILRQNLDKMKLIRELALKLDDLDMEQKARLFLNRKTVEYFRRKKIFRCITDDNPATIQQDMEKFKEATSNLDYLLGKEEETMRVSEMRIFKLESEAHNADERANAQVQEFEDMVRKTLYRESFDKLKVSVENQLNKMAILRTDITKVRTLLIRRQHSLATLMVKLEKLENLGNDLKMRDFENLQTETQALGRKIEERNVELNKLRLRCNADLHIMAHMKMKQQMLSSTIEIQESALLELIYEKQCCREYLYDLKINRGRIRKEIQELSFQGGLLDKPALMLDYDETVNRLEQLRAKVEKTRARYADIQHRIHTAEGKCDDEY